MPVGVASSPSPPDSTRQPDDISSTAGTGTGSSPWAVVTRPEPSATALQDSEDTPRQSSAAQTPTTSAIESQLPASWKCTSSGVTPCTRASASASRRNTR